MALITCPECGREKVSDSAISCPDCGYGIKEHFEKIKNDPKNKKDIYAFCPVCGWTRVKYENSPTKCKYCNNTEFYYIDFTLENWDRLAISDTYHDFIQNLSAGKIFDEALFQDTFQKECKRRAELEEYLRKSKERPTPIPNKGVSCPYCSSYNVRKIGMTGRLVSTSLFGLGSKKVGKQWHCNNCKSDF